MALKKLSFLLKKMFKKQLIITKASTEALQKSGRGGAAFISGGAIIRDHTV